MTIEEARKRAAALDARIHAEIGKPLRVPAHKLLSEIRAYLFRRSEEMETSNNPNQLLKFYSQANDLALITLGPSIDKGPDGHYFRFDSGARLSFLVVVRERKKVSELVTFRFHFQLPEGRSPEYFRFDLNEGFHDDPLSEPRCHFHPGLEKARIPLYLHDPVEILDRIFFVLEKNL